MLTKEKLQKMTMKGKKEGLKAVAKKEKELKRYDEKLLKKFKKWITYMITETAKSGVKEITLPINPLRWEFKNLDALDQVRQFLGEWDLMYVVKRDASKYDIPLVIISW